MFDANFRLADDGSSGVEQVTPSVWVKLSDLPTDPDEDDPTIEVNGVCYTVRERQRDPIGDSVRLLLHRLDP